MKVGREGCPAAEAHQVSSEQRISLLRLRAHIANPHSVKPIKIRITVLCDNEDHAITWMLPRLATITNRSCECPRDKATKP